MKQPLKIAFLGNSLPRRCGIATFTSDLEQAVANAAGSIATSIVAMNDKGQSYAYPPTVRIEIADECAGDYTSAAQALNAAKVDIVCLQHEFGIFGGPSGSHILPLLMQLKMPVVTTFHTVLSQPTPVQHDVMTRIAGLSAKVVVMAEKGRELLRSVYQVPADKIEVIPHGIPDHPFVEPDDAKAKLGYGRKPVILTFGLLSPNKGIEVMIDAMPQILESRPDALYVVLGATHPHLVRDHGETYRESLKQRVHDLGIDEHVVFLDRFVDKPALLDFISMCDVYVTPYLNEAQMTSGTLAYSFGLGRAVVSTPYWHASELLAGGRGLLVPFGDAKATAQAIASLLTDTARRQSMRRRAYETSRSMTWERTAERYLAVFDKAKRGQRLKVIAGLDQRIITRDQSPPPAMALGHFLAMCDDTGLLQHAIHCVPDRAHGYCVDDNARALLLACALDHPEEKGLPEPLISRFAAFVQHAWNPDTRQFRNFMGFDRRWLEERGSEDSHARTLWALGVCAQSDGNFSRRQWAMALFAEALPIVESFRSPRAWAFTLLGLDAYCAAMPDHAVALAMRRLLAERLMSMLAAVATKDWTWFEDGLSYDNARLPQALIVTGMASGSLACVAAGLRSLRWLMRQQTSPSGCFRPVGTGNFGHRHTVESPFDQQPLEATATIAACLAAWRAEGDASWKAESQRAFAWFLGSNDLNVPLVDIDTGSCRDGLHSDRANENRGGESVVSYLLGLAQMRALMHINNDQADSACLQALNG